ncbi:MAG: hypothetical protein DWQ18_02755 [Crenarchaeota archaeon]|nr:MAG: hypothetical protein DWQ17_05775 [Thermoproteota archaeon]RDJ33851.1 MAG: hypothetical protein DWQ18_02755 [Thermoproteota archaeon]RDJ37039.1 MAG: hypothetical protein DWQ13_07865 [Thermoproteota archaeon]RDJ37426.1 MAG: hypothetical protein DWQ19_02970 [Thermoproteota archaeon]
MSTFENFSQENYDRLKIFLISNFSLIFQPGDSPGVDESFEITTNSGKVIGSYGNNVITMMHQNSETEHQKIIKQIQDEFPHSKKIQEKNSDSPVDEKATFDYASISKKFYDHIMSCDECRNKFEYIWKHAKFS